jgi:hypothetical protein
VVEPGWNCTVTSICRFHCSKYEEVRALLWRLYLKAAEIKAWPMDLNDVNGIKPDPVECLSARLLQSGNGAFAPYIPDLYRRCDCCMLHPAEYFSGS